MLESQVPIEAQQREKESSWAFPTSHERDSFKSHYTQDKEKQIESIYSVPKIAVAKKVLRNLNQSYTRLFMNQGYSHDEDFSEKRRFFNSNILYFIAVTDRNEDTLYHSQLVAGYTLLLTKSLRIEDKKFLTSMERGAMLHDIGKIGIPESILRKEGPLTPEEKEIVKDHPVLGYEMIKDFNFLKKAAQVVLYHHEKFNGSGYPFGLAGEEIPLEARIFALADTLDAITSDRPYRKGLSFEEALWEIEKSNGSHFDPLILDVFLSLPLEEFQHIKEEVYENFSPLLMH